MLGEKDHGKSTLIGNLLISTGHTSKDRIKEATKAGKRFEPAHILDSFAYERENEMTLDTTRAQLVYKDMIMGFIDVPGHLELINNALTGASNAEVAIVMVSSKEGEGFTEQTRRHIFIAGMLGIKGFVFAINKLDMHAYDKNVFDSIKGEAENFLKEIGLKSSVEFVPISAYDNENMANKSSKISWYSGEPLLETVYRMADRYSKKVDPATRGVRLLVQDTDEERNMLFGIVYYGKVKEGETLKVFPSNLEVKINEMYVGDKRMPEASARKNVTLILDKSGSMPRGSVLSTMKERINATGTFSAKLFLTKSIKAGDKSTSMRMNNMNFPISKLELKKMISPTSGKQSEPMTDVVQQNQAVLSRITLKDRHPVEKFSDFEDLGRFSLYVDSDFCGFGIIE